MLIRRAICISDEQTNLEIKAALKETATVRTQDINEVQSLSNFIANERDMYNMDFLIVDLRTLQFSNMHIISSMRMMRRFCSARPIFIAEKSADTDILFGSLAEISIKDCIAADGNTDIAAEVVKCVSGDNERSFSELQTIMQNAMQERMRKEVNPKLQIPKSAVLTVAVCGVMERIGTTTQVIGIYQYLKQLGFVPLVVDKTQRLIEMYTHIYKQSIIEKDNSLEINGVDFGVDILIGTPFNAFIYELGTGSKVSDELLRSAYFHVIVGGLKEWEFEKTIGKMQEFEQAERLKVILSFSNRRVVKEIGEEVGVKLFAAPYMPDFWNNNINELEPFYREIFYNEIKEYCRKCEQ